uniref:Phloem filament protein n=1 Tax=Cucumis sativus TaxID=3659 RepID=A0A0A0K7B3_CUCSA
MSSDSKNDKWIQIPDTKTPCVIDLGKYAVDDYNKAHKDNLVFKKVIIGWYLEIDYDKTKLRLIIEVVNSKGEVIIYEVVIVVDDKDGKKVKTPISFIPGYIDEAKDCLGRVRDYEALVEEEKKLPNAILKLIYFKVIPKKC